LAVLLQEKSAPYLPLAGSASSAVFLLLARLCLSLLCRALRAAFSPSADFLGLLDLFFYGGKLCSGVV